MDELANAAHEFRTEIENTPSAKLPIGLQNFPDGACGDATLLLGYHLKSRGFGTFEFVVGIRGEDGATHSHAWLRQGDVLIDITADHFPEMDAPVIVSDASPWHDSFAVDIPHEADFHIFVASAGAMLSAAYKAIVETLEARRCYHSA